ncbi:MAG: polyphenol oxidase family protein [Terrimicrobiaceae bacterium]|nr:polyphenol oxidase family protein [Terrimicrobiaceae bacterium]
MSDPVETFAELDRIRGVKAVFIDRIPGVNVATDRETALALLTPYHDEILARQGFAPLSTAEQVHGNVIAVADPSSPAVGADGLITATPGVALGIYVADCAAVFLADQGGRAIGLVHSGRKGTELGIVPAAIRELQRRFAVDPGNLCAVIAPCIRPPHYEVDFAAEIRRQLEEGGVLKIVDSGACTASDPERYYSYRRERGQTGRMLAAMQLLLV